MRPGRCGNRNRSRVPRAMRACALFFFGAGLWTLLPCAGARAEEPSRIGRIRVTSSDVFGPEDTARGFIYRGANALHVVTRESTIRRFLLFDEGDPYEPDRLAESERNLRALGLFRSVSVVAGETQDGVVDVDVVTQDAWTVEVGLSAGSGGGAAHGGIALGEKNFLGTASELRFAFAADQDRTYRSIELLTPNFLLPYTTAHVLYGNNSDGYARQFELDRTFYSTAAPWAADVSVSDLKRDEFHYLEGGAVESTYAARRFRLVASYGIALAARDENASRLTLGIDFRQDRFGPSDAAADFIPPDRLFRYVVLQWETLHADFLKWNYVNHDERYEDITVGPRLLLRVGLSPRAFGVPETTELVGGEIGTGTRIGANGFLQSKAAFETRLNHGRMENATVAANLLYVHRFASNPKQTLLAQVSGLRGWNIDPDVQIFADAQAGLRGYQLRAFEGDGRVIVNVEHRVFSGWQWFGLISPGLAAFVDAGLVGSPANPMRLGEIKVDAGIGLRLAMSWAPVMNVFRLDAAYAFQRDPTGRKGWLISFSTGQAF